MMSASTNTNTTPRKTTASIGTGETRGITLDPRGITLDSRKTTLEETRNITLECILNHMQINSIYKHY